MSMHLHLAVIARTKASGGGSGTNVDEAFFGGGQASAAEPAGSGASNVIDYFDRTSTSGNATDRGDMAVAKTASCGVHNATNGFYLGATSTSSSTRNSIDYIDITTTSGNASDVGDLTTNGGLAAGVQGSTYGYRCGNRDGRTESNVIDYITLSSTSQSATDRGDLSSARGDAAGVSGSTYGFVGGAALCGPSGKDDAYTSFNWIDYLDTSLTTGNAADKGDLTVARRKPGGVSGASYGFFCGGFTTGDTSTYRAGGSNVIDYINIATTSGNATDRGDLNFSMDAAGTDSNGYTNGIVGSYSTFDYFDVTTTSGNGTDRGDRSVNRYYGACAN